MENNMCTHGCQLSLPLMICTWLKYACISCVQETPDPFDFRALKKLCCVWIHSRQWKVLKIRCCFSVIHCMIRAGREAELRDRRSRARTDSSDRKSAEGTFFGYVSLCLQRNMNITGLIQLTHSNLIEKDTRKENSGKYKIQKTKGHLEPSTLCWFVDIQVFLEKFNNSKRIIVTTFQEK